MIGNSPLIILMMTPTTILPDFKDTKTTPTKPILTVQQLINPDQNITRQNKPIIILTLRKYSLDARATPTLSPPWVEMLFNQVQAQGSGKLSPGEVRTIPFIQISTHLVQKQYPGKIIYLSIYKILCLFVQMSIKMAEPSGPIFLWNLKQRVLKKSIFKTP